jgi:hypothetical protein
MESSMPRFARLDPESIKKLTSGQPSSETPPETPVASIETRPAGVRDLEALRSLQAMLSHEINAADPLFPQDQEALFRITEEELRNPTS